MLLAYSSIRGNNFLTTSIITEAVECIQYIFHFHSFEFQSTDFETQSDMTNQKIEH